MALIKIYGVLDLLTGLMLILGQFGLVSWRWTAGFAIYLIIKSIMYFKDAMTWVDLAVAAYLLISLIKGNSIITIIFAAYLFIKGIWSLM